MRRTLLSSALRHGSPLLLACLLAPLTHAQEARPPRAVPVEESASAARPPRAIPVDDDAKPATRGPAPTPAPPRAIPAPENDPGDAPAKPAATPSVPKRTPKPPAKTADPETDLFEYSEYVFQRGDYRLSAKQYGEYLSIYPQGRFRDEARFKLAESHYRNKFNDLALQEFDIYVRDFPNGKNRAIAYYHAGEAHYRIASQLPAAERAPRVELAFNAYRASLTISRSGPYACYAAFRLGTYAYNAAQDSKERYQEAVRFFTIAASQSPKDQEKIRATALFFLARSHRYLSQNKDAKAAFEQVRAITKDNPYYDKALEELAQLDLEAGRSKEAKEKFDLLARESTDAETKANSLVNSGMLLAESDEGRAEALVKFEEALKIPGERAKAARARARFGLVWGYHRADDKEKVLESWRGLQSGDYGDLDEYNRARLWLIVGAAYAGLDKHAPAAQTYRLLESLASSTDKRVLETCQEAGYKRIVSLFRINDPALPDAVDEYVRLWNERFGDSDYLDKSWLAKGSWYFNRNNWEAAAKAYGNVRIDRLDPARQPNYLYQRGWSEASAGSKNAVTTLSSFLEKNAADERAPVVQLQRGMARLKAGDSANALLDFDALVVSAAGTETGESALYQGALVKGTRQDFTGMVASFQKLLADYPKTRFAAEAHYWIGAGLYQLQKFPDSITPLTDARRLDPRSYLQEASLMLIGAHAAQKDIDGMLKEVDAYLNIPSAKKPVPPDLLRWLGLTLYRERKDYPHTARYLAFTVNHDAPAETDPDVWLALGESLIETKENAPALRALDALLTIEQRKPQRARTFLLRGRALLGLNDPDEARKSVTSGLEIDRETLLAAQLHMLSGDIASRTKLNKEALGSYNIVRMTWEDPVLTPTAIQRMILILGRSTDPADKKKAADLKAELASKYPRFKIPG